MSKKFDDSLFEDIPASSVEMDDSLFEDIPTSNIKEVSKIESGLRGAAQGLTFDFADEISGGAQTLGALLTGGTSLPEAKDFYRQAQEQSEAEFKAAQEANPATFTAASIVGGIAPALATGGASIAAKAGTMGLKELAKQGAKLGAKQGAISGLGASEANLLDGDIKGAAVDTAVGAGLGAGLGAALPAVGKSVGGALKGSVESTKNLGKKAASFFGGIDQEVVDFVLKNPKAMKNATGDTRKVIDQLQGAVESTIKEADSVAIQGKKVLSSNPTIDVAPIVPRLQSAVEGLDDAGKATINKVIRELDQKSTVDPIFGKKAISEKDLKETLGDLYDIAYKGQGASSSKQNIKMAAREISETIKQQNPEYAQLMQESAELYSKSKPVAELFGMSEENAKLFQDISQFGDPQELSSFLRMGLGKKDTLAGKFEKALGDKTQSFTEEVSAIGRNLGIEGFEDTLKAEAARTALNRSSQTNESLLGASRTLLTKPIVRFGLDKAGTIQNITKATSESPIIKGGRQLMNMPRQQLQSVASRMTASENQAIQAMGRQAASALEQPDAVRKAMLWSLGQQPAFRSQFEAFLPDETQQFVNETRQESAMMTTPEATQQTAPAVTPEAMQPTSTTPTVDPTLAKIERNINRELKQIGSGASSMQTATKDALLGSINEAALPGQVKMEMQEAAMSNDYGRLKELLEKVKQLQR